MSDTTDIDAARSLCTRIASILLQHGGRSEVSYDDYRKLIGYTRALAADVERLTAERDEWQCRAAEAELGIHRVREFLSLAEQQRDAAEANALAWAADEVIRFIDEWCKCREDKYGWNNAAVELQTGAMARTLSDRIAAGPTGEARP